MRFEWMTGEDGILKTRVLEEACVQRGERKAGSGWVRGVCIGACVMLDALLALIFMEAVSRNSYDEAMIWLIDYTPYVLMDMGLAALVLAALVFLFGRAAPALALGNGCLLLFAVINRVKLDLRGEVFQYQDLGQAREGLTAAMRFGLGSLGFTRLMGFAAVLLIVLVPLLFAGMRVLRGKPRIRLACLVTALVLCAAAGASLQRVELPKGWAESAEDEYRQKGLIAGFMGRTPGGVSWKTGMTEPEGYGREAVEQVLGPFRTKGEEPDRLPNILFVMSESLFDMTGDYQLSEDPLTYFKELQQRYWGGELLSPTYGGGTSMVEYEVLTGYSVSDTDGASFNTSSGLIVGGMASVVSVLEGYGYETMAIHPNTGKFYNRRSVYKLMGFDSALFSEELPAAPQGQTQFPSDEYLFEQIIAAYERRTPEKPWFCHVVTYQNHGGYDFTSDLSGIEVLDELGEREKLNVSNFVNLLRLSDEALRGLIAYFDEQPEPTVIVIWGDHAPAFSQFGAELPQDGALLPRYYTTPLLIYSNYGLELSAMPRQMRSYRLGALVLRALGLDADAYLNYVGSEDACDVMTFGNLVQKDGLLQEDGPLCASQKEILYLLHYDRIFGENYGEAMNR